MNWHKFKKLLLIVVVISLILTITAIVVIDRHIKKTTHLQLFTDISKIPKNKVGLLLGTAKYMDKARQITNPYYQNRIDVAAELYMAGKVDYVIVSGDSSSTYYNEPKLMRGDLVSKGVPNSRIISDNGGFRTLSSIMRCHDIYGQTDFTIISQKFHDERALYLANHKNLHCVAVVADDGDKVFELYIREKLARVKMMLDLYTGLEVKATDPKVIIN